jgi:hypothetical protein
MANAPKEDSSIEGVFCIQSRSYWQERQRHRPPESVLPQSERGYAAHP